MKRNKRIAVTGGIGSGKSTLLEIIRQEGFPVFSCDEVSAMLWKEPDYKNALAALFPECCVQGEIAKHLLTEKVFSNAEALKRLNSFSHNKIMERLFFLAQDEPIAFFEVPLLFEGGYENLFDRVIVVMRNQGERVASVCKRDGVSPNSVLDRIKAQADYENFHRENVVIIENDSSFEELKRKFLSRLPSLIG